MKFKSLFSITLVTLVCTTNCVKQSQQEQSLFSRVQATIERQLSQHQLYGINKYEKEFRASTSKEYGKRSTATDILYFFRNTNSLIPLATIKITAPQGEFNAIHLNGSASYKKASTIIEKSACRGTIESHSNELLNKIGFQSKN